jgi:hypothetical protein
MPDKDAPLTKRICGFLHYKLPCFICGELIWTSQRLGGICYDCLDLHSFAPHVGNPAPLTPRSERQYNGD